VVVFERLDVPYLVTGSIAAIAYGEPRLTNDIDIVAAVGEKDIPALLESFPDDTYYVSADAIREAVRRQTQFNIIHPASGLKIDVIIMRDTAFDKSRLARIRRIHPAPAYEANFAAPEDVIIKKMQYYAEGSSEKHLRDIAGIPCLPKTRQRLSSWSVGSLRRSDRQNQLANRLVDSRPSHPRSSNHRWS